MNSKNGAEWLRASLCLKKGKSGRKSLSGCDTGRSSQVTKRVSTAQVTCQDVHLSSDGNQTFNDGQGSFADKLISMPSACAGALQFPGKHSFVSGVRRNAEVSA